MAEEKENKVEEPKVEETKSEKKSTPTKVKIEKPKETLTKVNLSKPVEEGVKEQVEEKPVVVNEEVKVEEKDDTPVIQDVTNEKPLEVKNEVKQPVVEPEPGPDLQPVPENIEKLMAFMEQTGGDLNDYVKLNRDISKLDDSDVLDEYYRTTKSHLTPEERNFMLEENYGFDEEVDDAKQIKKKKIALKEQVAEARAYLDRQKSKYYEDIKAGSKMTPEQQEAIDFYHRHNAEVAEQEKLSEASKNNFLQKTENVFNENFKGFDYQIGDKKFRFNVKDVDKVKETQSDIRNFVNKFVDKDNTTIEDPQGYHKSLYTAMNADRIAQHFYEQGKADAIKETIAKDKNIDMNPRKTYGETEVGGVKYRVLGDSSRDFKFKIRKKN